MRSKMSHPHLPGAARTLSPDRKHIPATGLANTGQGHEMKQAVRPVGCLAIAPELYPTAWPCKFKPDLPPRYDGTLDPAEFLQLYTLSIRAAGGGNKVMAC
ncbi:hypothetical protein ZWY2020_052866 [Hordeum vulgare]|nr:hypothetical protein ZWY2020_052866 [Hordeum vulgare]